MKKFVKSFLSIILVFAILFGAAPLSGFKGVGSSLWKGLCTMVANAKNVVETFSSDIYNNIQLLPSNPANYADLDDYIAKFVPATSNRTNGVYDADELDALDQLIASFDRQLSADDQDTVDGYLTSLKAAVAALTIDETKAVAEFAISTDKATAVKDDVITVSLKLKTNYPIYTMQIPVLYDATAFEIVTPNASVPKAYLTFTGSPTLAYKLDGNSNPGSAMYKRNSNPSYWSTQTQYKVAYATWTYDGSINNFPVTLDEQEVIATFQLKVISDSVDTSGKIFLNSDWIKTVTTKVGCFAVGRTQGSVISVLEGANYQIGQTIILDDAKTELKITYLNQTHTVDNYQSAYAEYKKVCFASAGTPLDGSNGNPDFCIPGLSSSNDLVPQGLGYDADANVVYITSYKSSGSSNSVLFALNGTTGEKIGEYYLKDTSGGAVKSHVGGVAVYNHTIYIASDDSILTYSTSALSGNNISANGKYNISDKLNGANCSYVTISDGILWTGNFYDEDEKYNQPADTSGTFKNSVVLGFDLTKANTFASYDYKFNIDNKIENIQSAYYTNGTLYLVSSYGRENDSVIYFISTNKGSSVTISATRFQYVRGLPMMENGFIKDGCLYSIFESAAWKYHGAEEKVSRDPSDVVWKIDLNQMNNNACILKRDTPSYYHDSTDFAGNGKYFIEDRYYDVLKKLADPFELMILKSTKDSKWGGSCFGIANTIALSKNGMLSFDDMTTKQGVTSYYELPKPCDDTQFMSVINYYHLLQKLRNGGRDTIVKQNYVLTGGLFSIYSKDTLEEIVECANKQELYVLSISHLYKGHAYVLVDCCKVDGQYKVKLFDCNDKSNFVYMYIKSDFSSFTLSTGDYKNGDVLELSRPNHSVDLDGERFIDGLTLPLFSSFSASNNHKKFTIVPEQPFTLTNAEGKKLVFDAENFSGDMTVYDLNIIFNDTGCEYVFEIDNSSAFTLDCNGKIDCSIGNNSSYFSAEAENVSGVTFTGNTMKLDGENIKFKAFSSTDEIVAAKELGLVSVSANATDSVTFTKNENSVDVSTDGTLSNVEASSYIGTDKETQTIEGDTQSFTVNSNSEEVIEKKEVHSVAINDITLDYKSSATITPQIKADDGASYTVTYNSSNPSAVSVDNSGRVTSNKTFGFTPGSAVITCKVTDSNGNTVTDTCTVSVQFSVIQWIIKIVLFGWIWY